MIITSVIDNESRCNLAAEHGLCLHIALNKGTNILFDTGKSELFASNAAILGLDIADVDIAVISHGHYDHGGGLKTFLQQNSKAPVYIHSKAFEPHYSLKDEGLKYIGLDRSLQSSEQLVFCNVNTKINSELILFSNICTDYPRPSGNRLLFGPDKDSYDTFPDEQNLLITEGCNTILIAGCAHQGILNILKSATLLKGVPPTHVFAGMHLIKSGLTHEDERKAVESLANNLLEYNSTIFYTMHCTGMEQYNMLKQVMNNKIEYLFCGNNIAL
ncbi:MAG: MBL fold metallo-hydrolase [Bacteroidaceae bacterium]|nr:MBL fold metallo-hydrolase [Bacteroidaceae bacterium]